MRRKVGETVRHRQKALNPPVSQKNEKVNQNQCVLTGTVFKPANHRRNAKWWISTWGKRVLKKEGKWITQPQHLGNLPLEMIGLLGSASHSTHMHGVLQKDIFSWLFFFTCFPFTAWWIRLNACRQYVELHVYKYYCHYVNQSSNVHINHMQKSNQQCSKQAETRMHFTYLESLSRDHRLHSMPGQSCWLFKHNIPLEVN